MKILYLTTEGFNTASSCNQMAMVLIREILNKGHQVHLVQSRRSKDFPDIPPMLCGKDGLTVDTINRKKVGKKNFVSRYLDEVKWAFLSMRKWSKVKDCDIVFLQSCPTAIFQLVLLKLFKGLPIFYNLYDMWPGNLIECGATNSRFLVWVLRQIQKIAYACCKKIAVLSEDMKQQVLNEGVREEKVLIIPAWFDDHVEMQMSDLENRFIQKYDLKREKFVVQFAGSIGYTFDYKTVLNTAENLKDEKNIEFHIIGDGAFKDDMVAEAESRELHNIKFFPLQPVEIVPDVYNACDIEIIPLRKTTIGVGVPSKAPIVMACKTVIINAVEDDSVYHKLFNENRLGISVQVEDSEKLAEAILFIYKNKDIKTEFVENAYRYTYDNYSSSVCIRKMIKAFEEIRK